jgi:hypothetical protein
MNLDTATDARRRLDGRETAASPFMVTALLEFEASLQLLAERARFLTAASGAAIAVLQGGQLVYCAASGVSVPDPGTAVDLNRVAIRTCLEGGKASWIEPADGFGFGLIVPVITDERVMGLVELVGQFAFEDREQQAVSRLAEMVTVALEHREAAFQVEHGITANGERLDLEPLRDASAATGISALPLPRAESVHASPSTAKVQTCASCGFPVSDRRTLCVDCEQNCSHSIPAPWFSREPEESWLSAHGYAVASIVVSALAALIIFWIRH